jgi:hypothetical protein
MENRTERVSEILETHLKRCAGLLKDCDGWMTEANAWGEDDLRTILGLTKACAQLGAVIGRLEAKRPAGQTKAEATNALSAANGNGHAPPANGNGHAAEIHESSGSIPQ